MKVHAYAAFEKGSELKPFEYDLSDPHANEVQIKIHYCGICHSDLHLLDGDWDNDNWPLVPGHEIVGEIVQVGDQVKRFTNGQIVGLGWQKDSCTMCNSCRVGKENLCSEMISTCVNGFGGFGEYINANERFVVPISQKENLEKIAPLLCGGVTVYNPLEYYNVRPYMHVGVVGLGGLGHMAVQFADRMGCEVTVFSSSPDKEKEALSLGADKFVAGNISEDYYDYFDFILVSATANLDWDMYLNLLQAEGKLCFVGAPSENISVDVFNLIPKQKMLCAGSIGSPLMIEQMMEFSRRQNIGAQVEVFDLKDVNEAIEKLRKNELRYRAVLKMRNDV